MAAIVGIVSFYGFGLFMGPRRPQNAAAESSSDGGEHETAKTARRPRLFSSEQRRRLERLRRSPSGEFYLQSSAAGTVVSGAVAISFFGAMFCLIFAILNPVLQPGALVSGEFHLQLADGTLVLRISTVFFASFFLWRAISWVLHKEDREFEDILGPVPTLLSDDARWARDMAQSAVFIAALFTLWILYARGVRTPITALLAYVFAFFSDDWGLISDCSRVLKGRLLRWHKWRLHVANLLLLAPLAVLAWQEFQWWGIMIWFVVIVEILLVRYSIFSEDKGRISREWRWRSS